MLLLPVMREVVPVRVMSTTAPMAQGSYGGPASTGPVLASVPPPPSVRIMPVSVGLPPESVGVLPVSVGVLPVSVGLPPMSVGVLPASVPPPPPPPPPSDEHATALPASSAIRSIKDFERIMPDPRVL
jgi:hypothetical protein